MNTRPITIMCVVVKLYASILNRRLQIYLEENKILSDEQNGFRAGRSCIDHIFTLITILRNRKSMNKSTFLCYIDFRRAFDSVDRYLLLFSLSKIGIVGPMYWALKALYNDPRSRVVLDGIPTDYFNCPLGVKQGSPESPTLFSVFIDNLAKELIATGVGVVIETSQDNPETDNSVLTTVTTLLYADDIVVMSENEEDLQYLLNIVHRWCKKWRLSVNLLKTNIMHVRNKRKHISQFRFMLGGGKK